MGTLTFKDLKKAIRLVKKKSPGVNGLEAWVPVNGKTKHYGPGNIEQIFHQIVEDFKK